MDGPDHPGGGGVSATLIAVAWAAAVTAFAALGLAPSGPGGAGRRRARSGSAPAARAPAARTTSRRRRALDCVGVGAARGAARAVGRPVPVLADPASLGAGLVLGAAVVVVVPAGWPLGLLLAPLPALVSRARRNRAGTAAGRAVLDELPEVIDLLGLGVAAGLTAPLAVAAVGRRGSGALAAALAAAAASAARDGRRLADVLDDVPAALGPAGDAARPLLAAVADAARHGTALGPSLDRLATEARTARRHRAEERARRVPILLLFPLVTCTLPALGLLTIAPLAVGALQDLRA